MQPSATLVAYGLDRPAHNAAYDVEHFCLTIDVGARAARCCLIGMEDGIMEVISSATSEVMAQ